MEEWVGELWHRMISRRASREFPQAAWELESLKPQLGPWFRALGGDPGRAIEGADKRSVVAHRSWAQRLAGSHRRFPLCWQDERSLRLPPRIAWFEDAELNRWLYFWLTAMAAGMEAPCHWLVDNQARARTLIRQRPGLGGWYRCLARAAVAARPPLSSLKPEERAREAALRQALLDPGSVDRLPPAPGDPMPVPLWLYPAPLRALAPAAEEPEPGQTGLGDEVQSLSRQRKSAQRLDDRRDTDGLLVFQLEALLSWAEQVALDRPQDEDPDQDLEAAAEDLDVITLARQRNAGRSRVRFDLDLPSAEEDDWPLGPGSRLPEWDYRRRQWLPDYCLLQPMLAREAPPAPLPASLEGPARRLRARFSQLRTEPQPLRQQPQGEELDLDAWLRSQASPQRSDEGRHFIARRRRQADLACLLLADLSLSTEAGLGLAAPACAEEAPGPRRVIDLIQESLLLFSEALSQSRDPFAIYGFSSVRNKQVRYQLLKNFAEPYGDAVRGRILATRPGFYTRMGAAIRQSSKILGQENASQRLLLILSDGKPNDLDRYEGRYGIEDTRQALLEAKRQGLKPFCVTIDDQASDYLPYLFGDSGYLLVRDLKRLPLTLPRLYLQLSGEAF